MSPMNVLSLVTATFIVVSAASLTARQATGVAGTWKLNDAESQNPNGPAPAARGDRGAGGSARGGGGSVGVGGKAFDATGGASSGQTTLRSELSPEEQQRIKMLLSLTNKAANVLDIMVEGPDVQIKQDGAGFPRQSSDGKKSVLKNPQIGEVNIKVKIDGKGLTREITTQEDLKVVETYALSADGKQLTVTVKESHPVMKIDDPKIKRVYNRQ